MCYAFPGPRCSSHAQAAMQSKRDAFIKATSEHIAVRGEIEELLDKDQPIPPKLDQRYGDAMMKVASTRQDKEQAQAEFDATPAGQKKLELNMEVLCSYDAEEWTAEHSDRLEHLMDRLEAGRSLRTHRMQELRKAQGYVELEEEDIPKPRTYSDMYFDISAARSPKPVFVYGSLMSGLHNSTLIGRTRTNTEGKVNGVALFANNHHYPYAVQVDDLENELSARGELIEVDDDRFPVTLFKLDRLEGYDGPEEDNHYNRVLTTVTTEDGQKVEAWMYVADTEIAAGVVRRLPHIKSGSWRDHLAQEEDRPWFNDPKYQSSTVNSASSEPSSKDLGADPPWDTE